MLYKITNNPPNKQYLEDCLCYEMDSTESLITAKQVIS